MNSSKPLTIVVFVGGKGTRLAHLTEEIPKAMVEVCGHPLFHYSIGFARCFNPSKIIFSGSHLFDILSEAVTTYDPSITMIKDRESTPGKRILGLVSVRDAIEGDVIIYDGDYIYTRAIAEQMQQRTYSEFAVHATLEQSSYMAQDVVVDVDRDNHLVRMEKTKGTVPLLPNQTYFNSLFYCPISRQQAFFDAAETAWRRGALHAEDAVIEYLGQGNPVDVVDFEKPLWMEVDNLDELAMGEKFVTDYGKSVAL